VVVDWLSFISPTHKRTEGLAPVWGSEFTSKDAALQGGDPAETAARLLVKMRVLVVVTARWYLTAYSTRNLKAATQKLKADEERVHSRGIRSCWFVLL
jgi:hypothetical protein